MDENYDQELAQRLRAYFGFHQTTTDAEVLALSLGTLARALIEVKMLSGRLLKEMFPWRIK
jgi:hypothetical protein